MHRCLTRQCPRLTPRDHPSLLFACSCSCRHASDADCGGVASKYPCVAGLPLSALASLCDSASPTHLQRPCHADTVVVPGAAQWKICHGACTGVPRASTTLLWAHAYSTCSAAPTMRSHLLLLQASLGRWCWCCRVPAVVAQAPYVGL